MTPMPCAVCTDERRPEIDEALAGGESGRSVSRRFDIPEANVRRHRSNHLDADEPVGTTVPADDVDEVPETPLQAARRRMAEEDAAATDTRLRRYTTEEAENRRREAERAEAERLRQEARERAEKLARDRAELEADIEEAAMDLVRQINELEALDREHTRSLRAAGEPGYRSNESLRGHLGAYLAGVLGDYVASWDHTRTRTADPVKPLRERDRLAATG